MPTDENITAGDASVFCAHCGVKNEAGAYSCDRCGERIYLPDPTKPPPAGLVECQACVTANEARASYCVKCGESLSNAARISILNRGDTARNVPHDRPSGIRLSSRTRVPAKQEPPDVPTRQDRARRSDPSHPSQQPRREDRAERRRPENGLSAGRAGQGDPEPAEGSNDSGTRSAKLPRSARGWNTAAFLIGPIWGPANGVWLGIVGLVFLAIPGSVPTIGETAIKIMLYLGYGAFLGIRGNELAWRARRWSSLEQFKRVQQQWMLLALVVNLVLLFTIPILLR